MINTKSFNKKLSNFDNFKYLGEFIYKENSSNSAELIERPKYKYQDLYEIEKDTKLEINEFNFITSSVINIF